MKGADASTAVQEQSGALGQHMSHDTGETRRATGSKESVLQQITTHTERQGKATPHDSQFGSYEVDPSKQLSFGKQCRGTPTQDEDEWPPLHKASPRKK